MKSPIRVLAVDRLHTRPGVGVTYPLGTAITHLPSRRRGHRSTARLRDVHGFYVATRRYVYYVTFWEHDHRRAFSDRRWSRQGELA